MDMDESHKFGNDSASPEDLNLADYLEMDIKEESIIKPYVDDSESVNEEITDEDFEDDDNVFIGYCFVCNDKIERSDIIQFPPEEFSPTIKKVIEDLSSEYVILVTEKDGLCALCRTLVRKISKLRAELRTAILDLRGLLRFKYSLPLPPTEKITPVDRTIVQVKLQQNKATIIKNSTTQTDNFLNDYGIVRVLKVNQGSCLSVKNKSTQVLQSKISVKHKKTQTEESGLRKKFESESSSNFWVEFSSLKKPDPENELESLEGMEATEGLEDTEEQSSFPTDLLLDQSQQQMEENNYLFENIGNKSDVELENEKPFLEKRVIEKNKTKSKPEICYVSTIEELERTMMEETMASRELEEQGSLPSDVHLEQISPYIKDNNDMFEDIGNGSESKLDNEIQFLEKSVIVTNNKNRVVRPKELKQPAKKKIKLANKSSRILKCGRCCYETRFAKKMKTHMLSFENREGFYCNICNYTYHLNSWYEKHAIRHSETSKDKRCFFCDEIVHDELHMRFHIEANHRENSFSHRCSLCKRVFMFASLLRKHERRQHKLNIEIFECEKCGKTFSNDKVKYNNHVNFYHRDSLECKFCHRVFPTVEKLILHERCKHRFEQKDYYQCSYCPKRFVRHERLLLHEEHHTGEYEFRCKVCGYGDFDEESVRKHMGKSTCKKTVLVVPQDHKKLKTKSRIIRPQDRPRNKILQSHKKRQREITAHKSLVCDVCGKIITTMQKYKIHRELHDNPPGFQCEVCGKKFRYKNNLQVHMKNLHKDANKNEEVNDESMNVSEVECSI